MLQVGSDLNFPQKPLGAEGSGEIRPEDLHRDLAMVLQVLSEVDRRHPTAANLPLNGVTVGEGGFETIEGIGHGAALRLSSTSGLYPKLR